MNYLYSPHRVSKMACWWDSVEEAAERPLRDENKNRVKKGDPVKMGSMADLSPVSTPCCLYVFKSLHLKCVTLSVFFFFLLNFILCDCFWVSVSLLHVKHQVTPPFLKSSPAWLLSALHPCFPCLLPPLHQLNQPTHSTELLLESCGFSDCLGKQMKTSQAP